MLIVRALLLAMVIVGVANADYKKRIQHHYEMYALLQEQEEIFAFAIDCGIYEAICYLEILEVSPWIREEDAIDALDHNTIKEDRQYKMDKQRLDYEALVFLDSLDGKPGKDYLVDLSEIIYECNHRIIQLDTAIRILEKDGETTSRVTRHLRERNRLRIYIELLWSWYCPAEIP